jgi:hypothetical protein
MGWRPFGLVIQLAEEVPVSSPRAAPTTPRRAGELLWPGANAAIRERGSDCQEREERGQAGRDGDGARAADAGCHELDPPGGAVESGADSQLGTSPPLSGMLGCADAGVKYF